MTAAVLEAPTGRAVRSLDPLLVQVTRYALVGGLGTSVNALAYLLMRTWLDAIPANLTALVLSTLVSTEVNRRFTFHAASVHPWREHLQTLGTIAFYACYSSLVLLALTALVTDPTPLLESATVAAASVLGGAGRFLLLRHWVFTPGPWPTNPAHHYRTV